MDRETILKRTTSFKENLLKALADPEEAQAYLEVAFSTYETDNDRDALLLAISDVVQAQSAVGQLDNLPNILSALDFDMRFEPKGRDVEVQQKQREARVKMQGLGLHESPNNIFALRNFNNTLSDTNSPLPILT
jgi:hypothetical protein